MNRFGAFAAALALLVSGIAIGALGTYFVLERHRPPGPAPAPPPPGPASMDQLERRLGLSADQSKQIASILEEGRREGDAIRRELKPRLDRQIEATRARIDAVLTPEQRVEFEELRREQRHRVERFLLDGPPPSPGPRGDGGLPGPGGPPPDEGGPPP
jgi:Spy/CpxP family protein refolding chaperone